MNLGFINKHIQVFTCASILFTIGDLYGAKTTNWTGNTDSDWNTSANWSNGVPAVNDTVGISSTAQHITQFLLPLLRHSNSVH